MKERPILFSGPMVRAILEGRKTQTRRVVKPQPVWVADDDMYALYQWRGGLFRLNMFPTNSAILEHCPYGVPGDSDWHSGPLPASGYYYIRGLLDESIGGDARAVWVNHEYFTWGFSESDDPEAIELDTRITPENIQWKQAGDRLWVREAFAVQPDLCAANHDPQPIHYLAESPREEIEDYVDKPSIHMPRWASRITLEVCSVRVERVQDISQDDAIAEGIECRMAGSTPMFRDYSGPASVFGANPIVSYRSLWDSINAKRGFGWNANPWAWVVEFRRIAQWI